MQCHVIEKLINATTTNFFVASKEDALLNMEKDLMMELLQETGPILCGVDVVGRLTLGSHYL